MALARGRAWFEKDEYIIIIYNYRVVSREGTKKNGTISSEEAKEEISCSFFVYFFFQEYMNRKSELVILQR